MCLLFLMISMFACAFVVGPSATGALPSLEDRHAALELLDQQGLKTHVSIIDDNTPGGSSITKRPPRNQTVCQQSNSTYNNGMMVCMGNYSATDYQFTAEERLGNDDPEERFVVFSRDNYVQDSKGYNFKVTPLGTKYHPEGIDGAINIPRCTAKESRLCSDFARAYLIMPPVIAARVTSKDTLYFRYGELQINAKLPSGDWIVPEMWLISKKPSNGETPTRILVAMARGNSHLSNATHDLSNKVLEAGIQSEAGDQMFRLESQKPWSNDYHNYRIRWTPDEIIFSVDGTEIGTYRTGGTGKSPFDREFYLVFGIHVGGNKDFPDSVIGKPWGNFNPKDRLQFYRDKTTWLRTWNKNSVLSVKTVTMIPV